MLDDLKTQYNKIVDPSPAQKQQYHAEVQRVQEIAKADPGDVYTEIGNQLGALMDAYDAVHKALMKEEINAKEVYRGDESIGRRALKRILITARLDAMLTEIRETMVYQAPSELGALWGKFEEMWQRIVAEQEQAHAEELRRTQIVRWQRKRKIAELRAKMVWVSAVIFVVAWAVGLLWLTTKSSMMKMSLGHLSL